MSHMRRPPRSTATWSTASANYRRPLSQLIPTGQTQRRDRRGSTSSATSASAGTLMIGHSKHSWAKFSRLLKDHDVQTLIDVRTYARSRFQPWFNLSDLKARLERIGITYRHTPELGGREPRSIRELREYIAGLLPLQPGTCFMCSEGDFRECHRHYFLAPLFIEVGITVEQIGTDSSLTQDDGPTPATLHKMREHLPPL